MQRPQITVITPAYNVGPYIGEAVDSVLAQTFSDFEYLVVDDGSTDNTAQAVREHVKNDLRVRLIQKKNGGAASARNSGLIRARGTYIAFLDGDDRWHADFLENQLSLLESLSDDVAAVFARSRVMSQNGRIYLFRWQRAGRYDFDDMLVQSCPPRVGSSLLIRKSALASIGGFTEAKTIQDLDTWLRIQRDSGMPYFWGNRAYLLDVRVRPGAISRNHKVRFEGLDVLIKEHSPYLQRYPIGMAYVRAAVFAYRVGDDNFAQRWARLARDAGLVTLLADSYGRRLLAWSMLLPSQRRMLNRANLVTRSIIGQVIGAHGSLLR
jgi:glycosyltransferase involved in cell wall biosynthesis